MHTVLIFPNSFITFKGGGKIRSEIQELEAQLVLTKRLQKLQEKMKQFD
jgi:hypothetical protein